jgi:hypothetical protein
MVERVIGMLAVADRPMKVFTSFNVARRWVVKQSLTESKTTKSGRGPGRGPRML